MHSPFANERTVDADSSWRHVTVTLKPTNRDLQPITLTCEGTGTVQVLTEMVEVLG